MFRLNTIKQYEQWDKKVEKWKYSRVFSIELLGLTAEIVLNRMLLDISEFIQIFQELI